MRSDDGSRAGSSSRFFLFWRLAIFSAAFRFFSISFWRLINWFGFLRPIVLLFKDATAYYEKSPDAFYSSGPPTKTASKSCLYLGHLSKHVKENNVPGDIRLFPETKIFR
ncbi:MAG TPA: hypothetical protein PLR43_06090, partial [Syntrophales bacterium]|nr:hypothetical protein [Syntrophales bacterium]